MLSTASPEDLLRPLTFGLLEAAIGGWEMAERRTLGTAPLVFKPSEPPKGSDPGGTSGPATKAPKGPPVSALLDAFAEWARTSGGWKAGGEAQALASLRLFLECCGDRPADSDGHADGDTFRATLRQLPTTYRKSAKEKDRPLAELIAEADARGAARIVDKTVKRHFWAVSRFFAFLMETGRLPRNADNPGRGFSFNLKGAARKQRDMWAGEELRKLFASPVWTGCHSYQRSRPGNHVIRNSLFWLPLLGLFHGNRLEEFAQLHREDVGREDGVLFLRITDEGGRQLKNEQSRRKVPLHPELIRVGFLEYVADTAPHPQDRLFPDLQPAGPDQKLGFGFSKRFSHYRKAIGVRRRGLDYHSLRHGVTTALYEAEVNEGWIDLISGRESGGESRRRYLKGVRLSLLRGAIDRVRWPEVNLSHLYVREAGDENWPGVAAVVEHDTGNITGDIYTAGSPDALKRACVRAVRLPAGA